MDFLTTQQVSELWGISTRRITLLCNQGRIEGATKIGHMWLIPEGAKKPEDPRRAKSVDTESN